jgi:SAM-dependent methyltransferase
MSISTILTEWKTSAERHCLDLRSQADYFTRHLLPSTSIPLSTLQERFSQLPPRSAHIPLLLLLPPENLFRDVPVADLLRSRGWNITHALLDSRELWTAAQELGIIVRGDEGQEVLFRATPLLERNIPLIEANVLKGHRALDLGCGSGRDLAYLARRDLRWSVTGVDNVSAAVSRTRILLESLRAKDFDVVCANITESGDIVPPLLGCFDLVLLIRVFPRPLFPRIHRLLVPGGYLLFSHFTDKHGVEYLSPGKEKRVQPGDVEGMLEGVEGWRVLEAGGEECEDGRPMWSVLARYEPGGSG